MHWNILMTCLGHCWKSCVLWTWKHCVLLTRPILLTSDHSKIILSLTDRSVRQSNFSLCVCIRAFLSSHTKMVHWALDKLICNDTGCSICLLSLRRLMGFQRAKHFVVSGDITIMNCRSGIREQQTTPSSFTFDAVFGPHSSQEQVFKETSPVIASAMDGHSVCIFAYGQTGTGKTYTMEGGEDNKQGISYRALAEVFKLAHQRAAECRYEIKLSMVEVRALHLEPRKFNSLFWHESHWQYPSFQGKRLWWIQYFFESLSDALWLHTYIWTNWSVLWNKQVLPHHS